MSSLLRRTLNSSIIRTGIRCKSKYTITVDLPDGIVVKDLLENKRKINKSIKRLQNMNYVSGGIGSIAGITCSVLFGFFPVDAYTFAAIYFGSGAYGYGSFYGLADIINKNEKIYLVEEERQKTILLLSEAQDFYKKSSVRLLK